MTPLDALVTPTETVTVAVNARDLADAFHNVLPHASTDKTLPGLTYLQLNVTGSTLTITATDRYTLAEQTVGLSHKHAENFAIRVSGNVVKDLIKRLASLNRYGSALVMFHPIIGTFFIGDSVIACEADQGLDFPRTEGLWPTGKIKREPVERIGFGPQHLAKFCKMRQDGKSIKQIALVMTLTAPRKPVLVTVAQLNNFRAIVMPVRVSD